MKLNTSPPRLVKLLLFIIFPKKRNAARARLIHCFCSSPLGAIEWLAADHNSHAHTGTCLRRSSRLLLSVVYSVRPLPITP